MSSSDSKQRSSKDKRVFGDIFHKLLSMLDDSKFLELLKELLDFTKNQVSEFRGDLVNLARIELEEAKETVDLKKEILSLLSAMTIEVKMQVRLLPNEDSVTLKNVKKRAKKKVKEKVEELIHKKDSLTEKESKKEDSTI